MRNIEIAWLFAEMADLLELKGENPYKIKAYRNGAKVLRGLQKDLEVLNNEGKLTKIPGIGKGLAEKIREILETGQFQELTALQKEIPSGLRDILEVSGIGPKLARTFWQELNIVDLMGLESAAKAKKLRSLPNVGSRTELNIKREIQILRSMEKEIPLTIMVPLMESLVNDLRFNQKIQRVEVVGEMRRKKDAVEGLDLLISTDHFEQVIEYISKLPHFRNLIERKDNYLSFTIEKGIKVRAWLVLPSQYILALFCLTGSSEHVRRLLKHLGERGYVYKDYFLFKGEKTVSLDREEDLYELAGFAAIPPELREDDGEIEAGLSGRLPDLITTDDILGDLHVHSVYSDGICRIEQLVDRALEKGYQYIAICDHSKSLAIANGLSIQRLLEQRAEIKRLNDRLNNFTVLAGIETDILADGRLDYPDEVLKQLDLVVASIHSGFKQDKEKMTGRIVSAMQNKYVNIIGHPTGRIIGRRKPYELDLDRLLLEAKKTGTVLEVNSSLDRLDLRDKHIRRAGEMSIPIAINTDAHDLMGLDKMEFGVAVARRGWRGKEGVINTLPIEKLRKVLEKSNLSE